jgi:hypothetical protein
LGKFARWRVVRIENFVVCETWCTHIVLKWIVRFIIFARWS